VTVRCARNGPASGPTVELECVYAPDDGALEEAIAILLADKVRDVDRGEAA
jgi:hypothetical protein